MTSVKGYAIVVKESSKQQEIDKLCFTSDSVINGSVWQVYKTKEHAKFFMKLKFYGVKYKIVPVEIKAIER